MKIVQFYRRRYGLIQNFAIGAMAMALLVDPAMAGGSSTPSIILMAMAFNIDGKTLGAGAGNVTESLRGLGPLITIMCYLGAWVFGIIGALKLKAYGEQPDRTPLKIPLTIWGIGVLLAVFSALI